MTDHAALSSFGPALAAARRDGGVFLLPPRMLLRLTGADRLRYLNGQVTNDLRRLVPGRSMWACVLTPKGKLSAFVLITATEEALLVEADVALIDSLPARLERYIIADDVTLEVAEAPELLHVFGNALNLEHPAIASVPGTLVERLGVSGKDLPASAMVALETVAGVSPEICLLAPEVVEALRIERGTPRWGRELTENTLPPEAGLEASSIDYDKGCYLGQEVISRLRGVGHVNRHLRGLFVAKDPGGSVNPDRNGDGGGQLSAGMKLLTRDRVPREVGELTSVGRQFDLGRPVALGYIRRGSGTIASRLLAADSSTGRSIEVTVSDFPIPHQ